MRSELMKWKIFGPKMAKDMERSANKNQSKGMQEKWFLVKN